MIGTSDALQETRGAFWRANIDDEIDVAPVDPEIQGGGGNDGAQTTRRHGRFDLTTLRHIEGAVMQRDREPIVVDAPQFLEDPFGLAARIDENERSVVPFDQFVDLVDRMLRGMTGPGQMLSRIEHADLWCRASLRHHKIG